MRLGNVYWNGAVRLARPEGTDGVAVLPPVIGGKQADSTDVVLSRWSPELAGALLEAAPEAIVKESTVRFRPAVLRPGKILCVGLNYRRHIQEMGHQMPEVPQLFSKFLNALASPGDDIPIPPETSEVDYEGELAVVIGAGGRRLSRESALSRVFGYTTANDVSARDLQHRTSQWLLGKSLDRFMPIGPWIVTGDEARDPAAFHLTLSVNGERRQDTPTADMIFSVPDILSYASQYWRLEPGDIILTGTPSGVINGMPEAERRWLQPGDVVVVEIDGVSRLTNRFVADETAAR